MENKEKDIDWKSLLIRFLHMYGEERGDWYPEHWEEYGITRKEAHALFTEYEKAFPNED